MVDRERGLSISEVARQYPIQDSTDIRLEELAVKSNFTAQDRDEALRLLLGREVRRQQGKNKMVLESKK